MHAEVAQAALENGAQIVNDVSGGRADPNMAGLIADAKVPWVLMHWRSVGADRPHEVPAYRDVVAEVRDELLASVDAAVHAGVDPGEADHRSRPGFRQDRTTQLGAAARAARLRRHRHPGARRRVPQALPRHVLAGPDGEPRPPGGRETATAVISALAGLHGAWGVRVHDVRASVDAFKVLEAWTK